jgi:hypothetical protein
MANRNYNRVQALEKESKHLYASVSIGASGAPTLVRKQGIASISRVSAGLYTVTLSDKYNKLMALNICQFKASGAVAAPHWALRDDSVASAKTFQVGFLAPDASTATDPDNGVVLSIEIVCKNSSLGV